MKLIYTSKFGTIEMKGTENDGFSIYEIQGLELLGRERSLVNFYNTDGYYQASARFGQRVITISGDIKNKEELQRAVSVLLGAGILSIETDLTKREITVNDTTLKLGERNGVYRSFAVQFICDEPHFTDCTDTVSGVYARRKMITAETVLPAVFTERSSVGIVRNMGDFAVEPVITVKSLGHITGEEGEIIIENKTTGNRLVIEHTLSSDEVVTIDIPNRELTSSRAGNILNCLAPGSYLSEMLLECGDNRIEVTSVRGNRNAEVYLTYRNLYAGVII